MHASLLRLGLVPLPRVECSIEIEVVLLCTAVGLAHRVRVRLRMQMKGTILAAATINEAESEGGNKLWLMMNVM